MGATFKDGQYLLVGDHLDEAAREQEVTKEVYFINKLTIPHMVTLFKNSHNKRFRLQSSDPDAGIYADAKYSNLLEHWEVKIISEQAKKVEESNSSGRKKQISNKEKICRQKVIDADVRRFKKKYNGICFIRGSGEDQESRHFIGAMFDGEQYLLKSDLCKTEVTSLKLWETQEDILIDGSVQETVTEFKKANNNMFRIIGK